MKVSEIIKIKKFYEENKDIYNSPKKMMTGDRFYFFFSNKRDSLHSTWCECKTENELNYLYDSFYNFTK